MSDPAITPQSSDNKAKAENAEGNPLVEVQATETQAEKDIEKERIKADDRKQKVKKELEEKIQKAINEKRESGKGEVISYKEKTMAQYKEKLADIKKKVADLSEKAKANSEKGIDVIIEKAAA